MGLPRTKAPHCWLAFAGMLIKGQLISKGLFGILNSSKKTQKQFDLRYLSKYLIRTFLLVFLEELRIPKSPFEIK